MSLRKIRAVNASKLDIIENASSSFVRDLERTLVRLNAKMTLWTRELDGGDRINTNQRNLARAVASRAQIEEMLLESGYRDSTTKLMRSYDMVADMSMRGFKYAGINDPFSQTDARAIVAIKNLDLSRWERQGEDLAMAVQQSILDSVVGGSSFKDMSERIAAALIGDGQKEAAFLARSRTIANTTLQGFDRTLSNRIAEKAGITTFIYLGPDDGITRRFCASVLSTGGDAEFNIPALETKEPIYTQEQIDDMDNGQGLPVSQFAGGYNCRHSWNPISVEVAQEVTQEAVA